VAVMANAPATAAERMSVRITVVSLRPASYAVV